MKRMHLHVGDADPGGVVWETFLTNGEATVYGHKIDLVSVNAAEGQCCSPVTPPSECCPPKPELAADAPDCGATA